MRTSVISVHHATFIATDAQTDLPSLLIKLGQMALEYVLGFFQLKAPSIPTAPQDFFLFQCLIGSRCIACAAGETNSTSAWRANALPMAAFSGPVQ